jgi:Anti-sigma-D factor RsdA to sigma factor binding region
MRDLGSDLGFPGDDRPSFDAGLDELGRTDLLLDVLAERADPDFDDPEDPMDEALAALLGQWRDDLRWPPASALVAPAEAVEALRTGIEERRRARHGLAAVGSVAASLLVLSGFGAVVAEARPGDALYGLHAMFFDERHVNQDHVVLSAKADMAKVQQMIDQGQWTQAQNQLAEISSTVQSMNNDVRRQDLINQLNLLNTKVESRDPNATLPPAAPPTAVVSQAPQDPPAPQSRAPRTKPTAPAASSPATTPSSAAPPSASTSAPPPSTSTIASPSQPTTTTSTKHHHHDKSSAPAEPTP